MDNNRIEREIVVEAPPERVWSLVARPGFWVADLPDAECELKPGALAVPRHEERGSFPVRVEHVRPETEVSYRWASTFPGEEPREGNSTLIEITVLREREHTRVRVVESGFAELDSEEDRRLESLRGNIEGWDHELGALRERAEQPVA
ncbi:polyketide cyclase [Amycolatopsis sp. AA4]|uniref:SRPBCC domain-containing protein n=1 Tax=Actinomycetes TaxID=1760 RepID=UPI0001B54556|nr:MULTISPECIES: SRPBCC domain-containing protein [Actinomycetes]ATY12034.1 polyketide cyclase [Amycolatopsis sp. AA4]EFL07738.1 predicted protein [Streptomyces sp. AA4]